MKDKLKERLDILLVNKGLAASRQKAKTCIMAGIVFVDGERIDKAGTMVSTESDILVKENPIPYVSRGGLKLEKAIDQFGLDLSGAYCTDMGASTGGFTDCMLQNGAKKVYSIDVGYGQLDYKLRSDERVVCMERTNIRYLDTDKIEEPIVFISIDVSFISLALMFPVAKKLLQEHGQVMALVKPQFEAGREQVGKNGIVKDAKVHREVIARVMGFAKQNGLYPAALSWSPVTGAKGNIEYLLLMKNCEDDVPSDFHPEEAIENIVAASHNELGK